MSMRSVKRLFLRFVLCIGLWIALQPAYAFADKTDDHANAVASVSNGTNETIDVSVTSWVDLPFQTVTRQAYDYSCGSAAIATLLTYIYGDTTPEETVFREMFNQGDQEKIKREGFSLLDMRNYLSRRGYKATGYKLAFTSIQKYKVPFIALVNNEGYHHFVVVKSAGNGAVLVGDPAKGNVIYSSDDFAALWNGLALVVTNHASSARTAFARADEWTYAHPRAMPREEITSLDLGASSLPYPNWQIAPTNIDILSSVAKAATSVVY